MASNEVKTILHFQLNGIYFSVETMKTQQFCCGAAEQKAQQSVHFSLNIDANPVASLFVRVE